MPRPCYGHIVGDVDTKTVLNLPLNGRDFRQMLRLSPGVTPGNNVNGNRYNNYQIYGADNNDAFHNTSAVNQGGVSGIDGTLLPVDAIDQFAVQTAGSADTGRAGGGAVNLVIKSGRNQVHGSMYYFNRNEYFAAQSPVATPGSKNRKIRNDQYGFSVGGPVIKNKLFFFATGEAQKAVAAVSQLATHPSDAWIAQAREVIGRYSIPVNPVSTSIRSLWPSRANGLPAVANNFLGTDNNDYDSYNGIVKLDYNQSLRETTGGLASCEGKLKHLGVDKAPKRTTLSYANRHRPWQVFETVFHQFLKSRQGEAAAHKRKFRFKHKLLSLDSTVIPLCLSVFDWAHYKRRRAAHGAGS